ncbi:hypothetical protein NP493_121g04006 [Ridgeia piscesae]|uniref:ILEI/PANDER domain-containing protein n=1 Tax=Ridgeia piscesae TaxID=27915 RepID=A0AAD9P620_RIDPI|nr:hypothetical protein NP493_121g04006 [Ridgeia piscesae]
MASARWFTVNKYSVAGSVRCKTNTALSCLSVPDKTHKFVDIKHFDTYAEDSPLIRYLKLGIKETHVILAATQDEASMSLKDDAKTMMHFYGSSAVDKLGFRDSLVMIGQRGLTHGSAMEKLVTREPAHEFANTAELKGCLSLPIGKLNTEPLQSASKDVEAHPAAGPQVKVGSLVDKCGVSVSCGTTAFPVHLFTGKGNSDGPKICVNGKYVMADGLNDGGRGFNIAIVNPKTMLVSRVGHFDTYAQDSSNLEIFLEMMNADDIILAVIHDDASKNLNLPVRMLLANLGSTMIEKLNFRDIWVFIGQNGIQGHSTIEEIEFAGPSGKFPIPIDKKLCVPIKLKGSQIRPDPLANKNKERRAFCNMYDGYGSFCETQHIDEALTPSPLVEKNMEKHAIFQVPVIVIPGLNHNAVRMQLETLLLNPGLNPSMVTVMCDQKFTEPCTLARVFHFSTYNLTSSTKYIFQTEKALQKVWDLYPKAQHVIVLEEEVIVSVDLLYFFGQTLAAVEADKTLIGISGWNDNGYEGLSTLPNVAYRSETFPGIGFLLKRTFYDENMKNKMTECCGTRAWHGWFKGQLAGREMIVPDVSRAYRRPYEGLSDEAAFLTELFNRPRVTNTNGRPLLDNADQLTSDKYEAALETLLKDARALDTTNAGDCLAGKGLGFYVPETSGKTYVIYFEQKDGSDQNILSLLCKCFKLFYMKDQGSRGLHRNSLRFSYKGNNMFLVGSKSPYYKFKLDKYKPVERSQL